MKIQSVAEDVARNTETDSAGELGKNRIAAKAAALGMPTEISYDERGSRWSLVNINGLEFATSRGKRDGEIVYMGQMLTLNDNDVDDRIREPKKLDSPGSDERFWVGTDGEHGERSSDDLKFYANDPNLNQKHEDQMDYTDFADQDYDFEPAGDVTPFDVLSQKQTLCLVNARLLPKSIATFAALNDNAQRSSDIGRALSGSEELSGKTLERRGERAIADTIEDIHKVLQQLAA